MTEWILSWPTWQMTRVLGIGSYLMLFVGMSLGMLYSYPFVKGPSKARVYNWHIRFTNGGTLLALLHMAVLVIDTYTPFTWGELLIPFTAHEHPVIYGIGTLALYGMLVLILTSDLRPKLKRKVWLAIHMLAYPIYLLALFHGILAGTDTQLGLVQFMYGATLIVSVGLFLGRATVKKKPGAAKSQGVAAKSG
ncbi:ferric reductase-like transmembrane domain-containing protein [Paenibacillus algorifonticola]|uniref:ferric reductase-like transmembrane domain-containing protein n=1 Tax=Paenibacillus algorifonticola TaxID=684063 RepID=UPI003D2B2300